MEDNAVFFLMPVHGLHTAAAFPAGKSDEQHFPNEFVVSQL